MRLLFRTKKWTCMLLWKLLDHCWSCWSLHFYLLQYVISSFYMEDLCSYLHSWLQWHIAFIALGIMTNAGLIGNGIRLSAVLCLAFQDGIFIPIFALLLVNREQICCLIYLAVQLLMPQPDWQQLCNWWLNKYQPIW